MQDIESRVRQIVAKRLQIGETEIKNEATFVEDLGADSLDTIELIMAFEQEFECEIPDQEAEKITTIARAIDFIKERTGGTSLSQANRNIPTSEQATEY